MFKKKVKLTEEKKQELILHYGTTDKDVINKIIDELHKEKRHQRIEYYMKNYVNKKNSKDAYIKAIYRIVNWPRLAGRERGQRRKLGMETDQTLTEKFIYRLDKGVLTEQFMQNGYSQEESEQIVDKIYPFDGIYGIKSLKFQDYIIDENKNVFEKYEKDRYQRVVKENTMNINEL